MIFKSFIKKNPQSSPIFSTVSGGAAQKTTPSKTVALKARLFSTPAKHAGQRELTHTDEHTHTHTALIGRINEDHQNFTL